MKNKENLWSRSKTLHELKEWWKNVGKRGEGGESERRHQHCGLSDQVPRHRQAGHSVPTWSEFRVSKSEGKVFDTEMFTHSSWNPELEKVLERKMMENLRCRVPSVETELDEPDSLSGKGKRMRVWEGEKCVKRFFLGDL